MNEHFPITHDASAIEEARVAIAEGHLVGMPTETVYGLAADASNPEAIARVYAAKGRPKFNPLISHVSSIDMACQEGLLDDRALALAHTFWPGPLTLVVPVNPEGKTCDLARAGLDTIALREPAHTVARALLEVLHVPLAAPSANPSGKLSPTSAEDVSLALDDEVALVIDGGRSHLGVESTIIGVIPGEPLRLLRPGAISREELTPVVGYLSDKESGLITAPGQLSSHYAPNATLRLNAQRRGKNEVLIGFGPCAPRNSLNLSRKGDTAEAAANLYRLLREADSQGVERIAVMRIPNRGLGEAINDRLRRAAAPRG